MKYSNHPRTNQKAKGLINFFKQPPEIEVNKTEDEIKQQYSYFRRNIFFSCFIGYIVYNVCRKNIAVALPYLTTDFGYTNMQIGILGSSLYVTYGIGKFLNGIFADNADVRKFMPTALIMSAIANICFALSAYFVTPGQFTFFGLPSATILLWLLAFFWGANGWFQSMGFPPIAKSLTYWFSNSERGTKWAIWSTSHQIGVFLAVAISGFTVKYFGFYGIFIIPAIICIIVALGLFWGLRDKPSTLGLPDIETYKNECKRQADIDANENMTYGQIFKKYILFNKTIWLLALAYVFVYIIRYGTEDWIIKFLVEQKENTIELATKKLSCLAFSGIIGAIAAGIISDKLFKGKRMPVNLLFLGGIAVSLWLLMICGNNDIFDYILAGLIGFFTAGPQLLIGGLCAVECSSKKVASASIGFTGIFGYIGAVFSSVGTGFMVDKFNWNGAVWFWIASSIICIGLCLILLVFEIQEKKCSEQNLTKV